MHGISGKVALLTGAGGYLGGAVAKRLAKEGAKLMLTDINEAAVQNLQDELAAIGVEVVGRHLDVACPDEIAAVVQEAVLKFGSLDIQVHAAGGSARIAGPQTKYLDLIDQQVEVIDTVLKVNLYGALYVSRAVGKQMVAQGQGGKIINFASTVGLNGLAKCVDYAAAKGGVIAMTKALAKELGPHNINVNAVAPGIVMRPNDPGGDQRALKTNFLGRKCLAEDIAGMVAFLVSDDASFITGQTYVVDGGRSLAMKGSD